MVFWAFATWLIPALVAAGWWRHRTHGVPLRYEATLWSVVFPLGMYAVAGIYLGRANSLPLVGAIGAAWLWVAFAAWALTLVAMIMHLMHTVVLGPRHGDRSPPPQASPSIPPASIRSRARGDL